jgi:hypothetical protein
VKLQARYRRCTYYHRRLQTLFNVNVLVELVHPNLGGFYSPFSLVSNQSVLCEVLPNRFAGV